MKLSIGYINDVHGYLQLHNELFYNAGDEYIAKAGGYGRIASLFKTIKEESENALFFDGGDTFHGTLPLLDTKGACLLPILNKLGLRAMVGHWDFAYGPEQLKNLVAQLNYPLLGINVFTTEGRLVFPPYSIIEIGSLKIAVIGICSNIIDKTMPAEFSEGLKVTDGKEELPGILEQVKAEGANFTILLSHNGFPQDMELLSGINGIDVCLSAHTHNRLYKAVKQNDTLVIQCGCHGSFVGHLNLTIENNKIKDFTYELLTTAENISPDAEIEGLVKEIMLPYENLKTSIVGKSKNILHRYGTLNSTMDDLLLAALLHVSKAQIAFSNGWRYGAPIEADKITNWDLFNIIPMNPKVAVVQMTGAEIMKMLESNLERTFSADPFKQMGGYVKRCMGIHVKMRIENPDGHRIQEILVGNDILDKDKTYDIAYVTSQGVPDTLGNNRRTLEISAVDAMRSFLDQRGEITDLSIRTFSLV